ncbi:inner-membrane translocator [Solidesulfovibrio fructosivorans JJ]]|uniref:Inner-membrane translocator n=2 Tax=Solidesulfovibrio fructosivorans TaxID=878 RepID=E1JT15_SOLFR|nr:ABC transporter permease [Solidesulfovibrio fructosivorans]EFL52648.1 inner-membrane translocator [Solidesulfovibrio fructosivorans JJ]]
MSFGYMEALFASVLFAAAPLILAALGETVAERAGVINLSLDGTLLFAAMAAFTVARISGNAWLGLAAGAGAGAAVAAVLILFGQTLRVSELAVGFVLTLFCRELAYFLGHTQARRPGPNLGVLDIPGLADLPFLGKGVFHQSPVVLLSLLAVAGVWFFLLRTKAGLLVRAVGESPEAAKARGFSVARVRFWCCLAGGAMAGCAGGFYSLAVKPGWGHPQGCEGAGWIALAIVIFGGWKPVRVAFGAVFFAAIQVAGIALQDALPGLSGTLFQIAPFPVMILTLLVVNLRRSAAFREAARRVPILGRLMPRSAGGAPGAIVGALDRGF